jgi:hypothetical protein
MVLKAQKHQDEMVQVSSNIISGLKFKPDSGENVKL